MRATRVVLIGALVALAAWAGWTLVADEAEVPIDREPSRTAAAPESKGVEFSAALGDGSSDPLPVPAPVKTAVETLHASPVAQSLAGLNVLTIDGRGAALQGVRVWVSRLPDDDRLVHETTGPDGTARLGCSAGRYDVYASDPSPGSRLGHAWSTVEVGESSPTEVTLTLPDATSRLEVVVRDDSGRPLEGIKLRADGPGPDAACGDRHTDASGLAAWEPVAAGEWEVEIRGIPKSLGVIEPANAEARIEVADGATAGGELVCTRKGTLVVRLQDDSLAAEIVRVRVDADRNQIARSVVANEPRDAPWERSWMAAAGSYVVTADWRPDSGHWSRPQLVEVESAGQSVVTIEALACQARITGHVRDAEGQPVRGVIVMATIYDSLEGKGWTARKLAFLSERGTTSAEDGSWALAVPIGRAGDLRMNPAAAKDRYLDRYTLRLEIVDYTRSFELVVNPGCGVAVRLEGEAASLADEAKVSLFIMRYEERELVFSDSADREGDGSFRFDHVGAGRYRAVLMRSNTEELTQPVPFEIAPGFREGEILPITLTVTERAAGEAVPDFPPR